jgi:hypothetical protein
MAQLQRAIIVRLRWLRRRTASIRRAIDRSWAYGWVGAFFKKGKACVKLWNHPSVGALLWLISFAVWAYWHPYSNLPTPGKAIGALAVVAGIMSVREMKEVAKISWVVLLIMLLFTEFRAIDKDHYLAEKAQEEFFEAQRVGFHDIAKQASTDFASTTSGLTAAITGLNSVLKTTNKVATLAKKNLANVTGGDSFAYTLPPSSYPILPKGYGLDKAGFHVVNAGDNVLSEVTVSIAVAVSADFTDAAPINDAVAVGTLAPHMTAVIPKWITPKMGPDGTELLEIVMRAQNGASVERLWLRPARTGAGWAYKYSVKKKFPDRDGNLSDTMVREVDWTEPKSSSAAMPLPR